MNDDDTQTRALATDEATGSVRPADARYNRQRFSNEQLRKIREQEIEEADTALFEQMRDREQENQEKLDASGYVNPTIPQDDTPTARAFDKVFGSGARSADDAQPADDPSKQPAKKAAAASGKSS